MANTMTLIASSTVGSGGAASIDFTSIPSTYTDLKIVWSLRSNSTSGNFEYCLFQFNGDTAANYSSRAVGGNGSVAYSGTRISENYIYAGTSSSGANDANDTANTFSNGDIYIPNYRSSNQKSTSVDTVVENNTTAANMALSAGIWTGTAAITSIKMIPNGSNWVQYSTAYLYGISKS
jgi:hypothetical protein